MTAGILIKNTVGTIQIDENYSNLHLTEKSTIVPDVWMDRNWFTAARPPSSTYRSIISFSGRNPVLAIHSANPFLVLSRVANGSIFTFTILTTSPDPFEYFVFDSTQNATPPTQGLVVRSQTGEVVFHSDMKIMNIRDFQSGSAFWESEQAFLYESGRKYAIVQSIMGRSMMSYSAMVPGSAAPQLIHFQAQWSIPGGIKHMSHKVPVGFWHDTIPLSRPTNNSQWSFLVLDVTNY